MIRGLCVLLRKFVNACRLIKQAWYIRYNRLYFRGCRTQFGKNLKVYNQVYVLGCGQVQIGDDFVLTSGDCWNPISRNIRGAFYTMKESSLIKIGDNVGISSSSIWAKDRIEIGNNVKIGGDCIIIDNDAHPHDYLKRRDDYVEQLGWDRFIDEAIPSAPIAIEDDVWIGARCQILKGVHIGARSIIAAGSIVAKDIPSDVVAGGNPCRVIRSLVKEEQA